MEFFSLDLEKFPLGYIVVAAVAEASPILLLMSSIMLLSTKNINIDLGLDRKGMGQQNMFFAFGARKP